MTNLYHANELKNKLNFELTEFFRRQNLCEYYLWARKKNTICMPESMEFFFFFFGRVEREKEKKGNELP